MKRKLSALVVDDDPQMRRLITDTLNSSGGWTVREAENADRAFEILPEKQWALVFCDVNLGGTNGYEVLRRFVEMQPQARFFLMTGYESASGALDATAAGAYDYLVKPFTVNDILTAAADVRRDYERRAANDGTPCAENPSSDYVADASLIGRSQSLIDCLKLVGRVAPTNMPVLISGESGTGKEMVARAIHKRSRRAENAFVAINCGALPIDLIESELFGHVRGSFTGASSERVGLWEEANGGTILLDEITETSPLFQIKLLRALQEGEIRRVGSNRTLKVDVRVIAATNRDIVQEVEAGRFRQDLMYRLNVITINLPPLRERRDDIKALAEHFARRARPSGAPVNFSAEALETLENYEWRGNIRELENAIFHAVSICEREVRSEHLPERVRRLQNNFAAVAASPASAAVQEWVQLAELEADYVARVLAHTQGNKQAAAQLLGIDRKRLSRIIKRYNLDYKVKVVFERAS